MSMCVSECTFVKSADCIATELISNWCVSLIGAHFKNLIVWTAEQRKCSTQKKYLAAVTIKHYLETVKNVYDRNEHCSQLAAL